jgi:Protein of unknown function DUF262
MMNREKFTAPDDPGIGSVPSPLVRENGETGYSFSIVSVSEAVDRATSGHWDVPEFQREFVWKPYQVCALADSMWRNYPFGPLLLWQAGKNRNSGIPLLIADGQQRLTALCLLYGTIPLWLQRKPEEVRANVRRRFDIRLKVSSHSEPRFVTAEPSGRDEGDAGLVPLGQLMAIDARSRSGSDELARMAEELKIAGCCPDLDITELYQRLRKVSMMRERKLIATVVNHQRAEVLDIFGRLNSRGIKFRRLLIRLMMEEIPTAIRGARGRYQP